MLILIVGPDGDAGSHTYSALDYLQPRPLEGAAGDKEDVIGFESDVVCLAGQYFLKINGDLGAVGIAGDRAKNLGLIGGRCWLYTSRQRKTLQHRYGFPLIQDKAARLAHVPDDVNHFRPRY